MFLEFGRTTGTNRGRNLSSYSNSLDGSMSDKFREGEHAR